jgi:hypothetical protein
MRNRLLVRHFLTRFFEHDLISTNADRHEVLSSAGGGFFAVSLFVAVLISLQYQFNNFLPPGLTSVRSLAERFLFVSASMLVMALLAVALWDGLALDARDTAVLGVLPVPRSAIVRAKFIAVALMAGAADIAWNLPSTLLRAVSLPLTLPVHGRSVLLLIFAHGLVTLSAGAFGFLAILALREGLTAVLGRDRFHRISPAVQATLLVVLISSLLLLPGGYTGIARRWLARAPIVRNIFPPLWFVGLNEALSGSVIDSLPHTRPIGYLVVPELNATVFYRSLWPLYHQLGRVAMPALALVALVGIVASVWNNRRLPTPIVERERGRGWMRAFGKWLAAHVVARSLAQQAGFWFTLQTLPRRVTHRAVLASALAVGLALGLIAGPIAILSAQSLLLASLIAGFRHAVQLPAEFRASSTFTLASHGELRGYAAGVKRAGFVLLVLPALSALCVWHVFVLGPRTAALHLCFGAVFSALVMQLLFTRYRRVPLVSGYVPNPDLKSRGAIGVVTALLTISALAAIERQTLLAGVGYFIVLVCVLAAVTAAAAAFDNAPRDLAALDLNEEVPLPTQRLNLAG